MQLKKSSWSETKIVSDGTKRFVWSPNLGVEEVCLLSVKCNTFSQLDYTLTHSGVVAQSNTLPFGGGLIAFDIPDKADKLCLTITNPNESPVLVEVSLVTFTELRYKEVYLDAFGLK